MESKIVYFDNPGKENTDEVLKIAKQRAQELGIKTVVVATTEGGTAAKAVDVFEGMKIVVVSHLTGMREPNVQELTDDNRKKIENGGATILTTTHAFTGIGGAMRKKFNMHLLGDVIASTLRMFGQGMKVVCEITIMAADAGLITIGEDIICVAGSGRGADTAVVISPVNTNDFFDLKIREILCKPHL
ncbi:pyruvate kinase alpha/beta domain-containing protein [Chloroflexota bacterium]